MVGRLQPDWISHGRSPPMHPQTPPSSSDIPKYHPDSPGRPSRHLRINPYITDANRHCHTSSNRCQIFRVYPWCQIVRGVILSWCQIVPQPQSQSKDILFENITLLLVINRNILLLLLNLRKQLWPVALAQGRVMKCVKCRVRNECQPPLHFLHALASLQLVMYLCDYERESSGDIFIFTDIIPKR